MNHGVTSTELARIATTGTLPAIPTVESPEDAGRLHAEVHAITTVAIVPRGIAIGEYLERMKSECGHGEWLPWLESHADVLGFKGTQARTYMRMYENRDALIAEGIATIREAQKRIETNRKRRERPEVDTTTTNDRKAHQGPSTVVKLPKDGTRARHMIDGIADRLGVTTEQAAEALAEIDATWKQRTAQATPPGKRPTGVQTKFRTTKRRKQRIERTARRLGLTQNELLNNMVDEMLQRIETGGPQ
jgi:hypothetical protein